MASLVPSSSSSLPPCSLSWTQNRRGEQRIKPLETLDLHGFTKEKAIREVTDFMERVSRSKKSKRNPFVCIITGTGSHSGALGGPILKQAVQKLFIKRQMEYSVTKNMKGSFLVNVHSGFVLTHNPTTEEQQLAASVATGDTVTASVIPEALGWEDTKVKVVTRDQMLPCGNHRLLPQIQNLGGKKARKHGASSYAAASSTAPLNPTRQSVVHGSTDGESYNPSELAAEEKLLQQAKSQSLQDTRKLQSQRDKEKSALEQALKRTQQEALEEQQREEEELRKAMELSQQEPTRNDNHLRQEEEEQLRKIMELSLQDAHPPPLEDDDEEVLQRILSESNLEHLKQQEEEEAELERVLRFSMIADQQAPPPVNVTPSEDDEELQRILRLSMVDASHPSQLVMPESSKPASQPVIDLTSVEENILNVEQHDSFADGNSLKHVAELDEENFLSDNNPAASLVTLAPENPTKQQAEGSNTLIPKEPVQAIHKSQPFLLQPMETRQGTASEFFPLGTQEPASMPLNSPMKLERQSPMQTTITHSPPAILAPTRLPTGEALLESILYQKPDRLIAEMNAASPTRFPITDAVTQEVVASPTPTQCNDAPGPPLPSPALEHQMLEMLQRPVTQPQTTIAIPASTEKLVPESHSDAKAIVFQN